jgi:hypothetical protein
MVDGKPKELIFSKEFIQERVKTHHTNLKLYQDIVVCHLSFISNEKEIHMYFGKDMFCQINMLTLLSYLDQQKYDKNVTIHLCDEKNKKVIDKITIHPLGFHFLYHKIMCEHVFIKTPLPYLNEAIPLYFQYFYKDKQTINNLLLKCKDLNGLLKKDTFYGLGDVQWNNWIKATRTTNEKTLKKVFLFEYCFFKLLC